jgi:hypothetical protein
MFGHSQAADISKLSIGANNFISWHVGEWFASCNTDKVENRSSCGAVLNIFDLPKPKTPNLNFFMTANRLDLHMDVIRGTCVPFLIIDPPHLKMNPAKKIMWRSGGMAKPSTVTSFQDIAGARMFRIDSYPSLQKAIKAGTTLYLKTIGATGETSFSASTLGYQKVCEAILAKEHELNTKP